MNDRLWTYRRDQWDPPHRWWPFRGYDEKCRRTVVLPIPFGGYLLVALWRDRNCPDRGWHGPSIPPAGTPESSGQ